VTARLPLLAWAPLQAPLAEQEVLLPADQFNVALPPAVIELSSNASVSVGVVGVADFIRTEALAETTPHAPLHVSV